MSLRSVLRTILISFFNPGNLHPGKPIYDGQDATNFIYARISAELKNKISTDDLLSILMVIGDYADSQDPSTSDPVKFIRNVFGGALPSQLLEDKYIHQTAPKVNQLSDSELQDILKYETEYKLSIGINY